VAAVAPSLPRLLAQDLRGRGNDDCHDEEGRLGSRQGRWRRVGVGEGEKRKGLGAAAFYTRVRWGLCADRLSEYWAERGGGGPSP
jgi:hypothetical protein